MSYHGVPEIEQIITQKHRSEQEIKYNYTRYTIKYIYKTPTQH